MSNMSSSSLRMVTKKRWVCTKVDNDRIMCEWKIKGLQFVLKKNGEAICSPFFYTGNGKEQWRLELFPRGKTKICENFLSCYLHLESSERLGIQAEFKISISKSKDLIFEQMLTHKFDKLEGYGWPYFIEYSKLSGPDYSELLITTHCKIDALIPEEQKVLFDSDITQLTESLRLLLENPKFSDVTIIVGGDKFPAHKSMLATRSSVFAAMFDCEMDENRKNEVKIEDMESAVVKGMLEFIYTGQVADIEILANGLLGASEKYDLKGLKAACEESLCKNLEIDNAVEMLILADLYRASELEEAVIEFIKDNIFDVAQTDGYEEMNDPVLLKKIISFGVHKK